MLIRKFHEVATSRVKKPTARSRAAAASLRALDLTLSAAPISGSAAAMARKRSAYQHGRANDRQWRMESTDWSTSSCQSSLLRWPGWVTSIFSPATAAAAVADAGGGSNDMIACRMATRNFLKHGDNRVLSGFH
jgi:hypothetical protein